MDTLTSHIPIAIGHVEAIFRYPVKSMRGEQVEAADLGWHGLDVRRFRPNIVVRAAQSLPFQEDTWVGGVLSFGGEDECPAVAVTVRDVRCSMLNFDPDSARPSPEVLKAVGQAIHLHPAADMRSRQ